MTKERADGPLFFLGPRSVLPLVFLSGGDATADVPLGLVLLQHPLHLIKEGPIKGGKALG